MYENIKNINSKYFRRVPLDKTFWKQDLPLRLTLYKSEICLLAALSLLIFVGACGIATRTRALVKGDIKVSVNIAKETNQDSPVAVDLVLVFDEDLLKQLAKKGMIMKAVYFFPLGILLFITGCESLFNDRDVQNPPEFEYLIQDISAELDLDYEQRNSARSALERGRDFHPDPAALWELAKNFI